MTCSDCGKEIPFVATICPYCQREKSNDQSDYILMWSFGIIFAVIGYCIWGVGGGVGGLIGGMSGAFFFSNLAQGSGSQPPEVKIVGARSKNSTEEKLSERRRLYAKQLITTDEYTNKKKAILKRI